MKPRAMMFDEPTSALDPEMMKEVLDTMVALAEDGMTMIVVTHEMSLARRVADRVVSMEEGSNVEIAEPDRFFDAPQNESTRRFLKMILRSKLLRLENLYEAVPGTLRFRKSSSEPLKKIAYGRAP